ncbi:MAG: hypothetical protein Q9191_002158 [Dirinaria sp. TL-2023a]
MPAMSGGIRKAHGGARKGGTSSSRKHRFESFNQRVSKIKIDPIRRSRPSDTHYLDLSLESSYFNTDLERWKDLNVSANFTNFVREVQPQCDSLPQLIHHHQDIMSKLICFIEKRDALSLEPLLDLLASFVHDLGSRFETHFGVAVTLVASLAATHSDVEVIEWSFMCLTWLFKYLSRLLVSDLRPLYRVVCPLLGKERQKSHTTQFAAEAMSFLIRKAAIQYHRDKVPLDTIVSYITEDFGCFEAQDEAVKLYQYGLTALYVETIKGVDRKLHSSGAQVFCCLLEHTLEATGTKQRRAAELACGVAVGLIHLTDGPGFQPILKTIISQVHKAAIVALQMSPLEIVIPHIHAALDVLTHKRHARHFLAFCIDFNDLNPERFHDLVFPSLSKWLVNHWPDNESQLYQAIPRIAPEGAKKLSAPNTLQQHIVETFRALPHRKDLIPISCAFLNVMHHISVSPSTLKEVIGLVAKLIQQNLRTTMDDDLMTLFSVGVGIRAYSLHSTLSPLETMIWPQIYKLAARFGNLPPYLEAVLASLDLENELEPVAIFECLVEALIENLHSSSHVIRKLSLEIMGAVCARLCLQGADTINTALMIENSPLDLDSARSASLYVRRLSTHFKALEPGNWLQRAMIHFCFGILTFKLSQLWDDAVDNLREFGNTKIGEETVAAVSFRFLKDASSLKAQFDSADSGLTPLKPLNQFQCSNLINLESSMDKTLAQMKGSSQLVETEFYSGHHFESQTPYNAPSLALRVLMGVPSIAEKHSRELVPIFLSWAGAYEEEDLQPAGATSKVGQLNPDEANNAQHLARKDRKTMLDLFGCFTNPKVLYHSREVFEALTNLVGSGDVSIQKAALKALLTWKSHGLVPYQDNLINILDDAKFREEVSVFVDIDRDNTVQEAHRRDLIPVLLRILYGKAIARSGPNGGRGQHVKRRMVFEVLSRFGIPELGDFLRIALGPLAGKMLVMNGRQDENFLQQKYLDVRKQVGLMNMIKDMLSTLGHQLAPLVNNFANAILYCTIRAARSLMAEPDKGHSDGFQDAQISLLKDIRQTGIQCLKLLFEHCAATDLDPFVPAIFGELVYPRMEKLPVETAQSVSGLLQLFATWSSSTDTVGLFADHNPKLVMRIVGCLTIPSAKAEVKLFVLDNILKKIARLAANPASDNASPANDKAHQALSQSMECVLEHLGDLMRSDVRGELLQSGIEFVSILSPLAKGCIEIRKLLDISALLLEQPQNTVKSKSRSDLLRIIQHFVPLSGMKATEDLFQRLTSAVSMLFVYFHDRENRSCLCVVLDTLAQLDSELRHVATLCAELNAYSQQKVDEPDFETRLAAFEKINGTQPKHFGPKQWKPVLYNMLFYVRDTEEIAIRSSASLSIRKFVEHNTWEMAKRAGNAFSLVESVLLPACRRGASEQAETVRVEYLQIMATIIRQNPHWPKVNDMSPLLFNEDEEASFFGNILHIQQHRRLRALRRVAVEARKGHLHAINVAHFLIPLIEHFVFDKADDQNAHILRAETIPTIAALASTLEWPQFRAMLRRYTGYIHGKPDLEKTAIKLVGQVIDALNEAASSRKTKLASAEHETVNGTKNLADARLSMLASTISQQEKLTADIVSNILPPLRDYLHGKDESTVSLRVPVGVSITKLLQLLPPAALGDYLPPVLMDICNILRSRVQESRDLTRKTLVEIARLMGPSYFGFILKELRSALARGYQLHVLSYTLHAILVATADIFKPGELDYCLVQMVSVIMDDIFGNPGQEKDAEEYISKMKEVKSSKSFDSMELLAKVTSVPYFVNLLKPLQCLLHEKLDSKMVRKVDELLRRIGAGLLRNEVLPDRRVLIFCHEVLRQYYDAGASSYTTDSKKDSSTKRYLVHLKSASEYGSRGSTSFYNYKLARFALDLLRSTLHKHSVLQTGSNLSGFLPIIGDSIVQANEEIQISALRLLTTIIKVPLKEIDDNAGTYITESVKIIKSSASTHTEAAQAAIKLVSAVLRERRQLEVKENDLAYLLKRLIPDLEAPDQQGVVFSFIKAILTRRIVITEIYEVMDTVATIMVTNQTKGARDLARSAYFQFIMDYPQGKGRFAKQLTFLVKNLDYKYEEGRRSVMEAMNLLLSKVDQDLLQEITGIFFVPLVMVVVNDDSTGCREMANALIKTLLEKLDRDNTQAYIGLLRTWLDGQENVVLLRAALQVFGAYLDCAVDKSEKDLTLLQSHLTKIFKAIVHRNDSAEWETLYIGLETFSKMCHASPAHTFAAELSPTWASIRQCLTFPHLWVKLSAARLFGLYFADFARYNTHERETSPALRGSGGLLLTSDEMAELLRASLSLLGVPGISEELAAQSARNILFLSQNLRRTPMNSQSAIMLASHTDSDNETDIDKTRIKEPRTASQYVFDRASFIIRRGPLTMKASSLIPIKTALQIMGNLCNNLETDLIMPSLQTILLPLYSFTDTSIPAPSSVDEGFNTAYESVTSSSAEIMSLLQKKVGTTEFIAALSKARRIVKVRREERRVKRRIEAVTEPEKLGKLKKRKGEKKREKRKERSGAERGRRRGWTSVQAMKRNEHAPLFSWVRSLVMESGILKSFLKYNNLRSAPSVIPKLDVTAVSYAASSYQLSFISHKVFDRKRMI